MRFKLLVIGAAIVVVATTVGVSGFTSAEVERQVNVDVVDDTDGLLQIDAGAGNQVFERNGQVKIDTSESSTAGGVNQDATFTFGANESNTANSAITVTNRDTVEHTVKFDYDFTNEDPDTNNNNVIISAKDGDTEKSRTAKDGQSSESLKLAPGKKAHLTVKVNTSNVKAGEDLDGELRIIV
jgi:uncharacterized cupredoxin-like copper-binding protein